MSQAQRRHDGVEHFREARVCHGAARRPHPCTKHSTPIFQPLANMLAEIRVMNSVESSSVRCEVPGHWEPGGTWADPGE